MRFCLFAVAALGILLGAWHRIPRQKQFSLEGSCVIVTGGSYGIGPVIADEMAKTSVARIVLVARSEKKLQAQADDLRRQFPETEFEVIATDFLKSDATVKAIKTATAKECQGAWVLINNAALAQAESFMNYELEDIDNAAANAEESSRAHRLRVIIAGHVLPSLHERLCSEQGCHYELRKIGSRRALPRKLQKHHHECCQCRSNSRGRGV